MRIKVERKPNRFYPNFKRVINRFNHYGPERSRDLVQKIIEMEDAEAENVLMETLREFAKRHRNLTRKFLNHFDKVKKLPGVTSLDLSRLSEQKKLLIGSYF